MIFVVRLLIFWLSTIGLVNYVKNKFNLNFEIALPIVFTIIGIFEFVLGILNMMLIGTVLLSVLGLVLFIRACNKKIIDVFASNYPFDYPEPITNYALLKNNYKVKEISVNMYERVGGKSSIKAFKSIYYMFNVLLSIVITNYKKYGAK